MKPSTAQEASDNPVAFPIVLNDRWRVTDDPLQWILRTPQGKTRSGAPKYRGQRFHRSRRSLIQSIAELCGPVDPNALAQVEALPEKHPSCSASQPSRRGVLKSGLALLGAAGALTGMVRAARADDPIEWTIADNSFGPWFFFEGDTVILSPTAEPMREIGLYAEPAGDTFRLVFVTVGMWRRDEPTEDAWREYGVRDCRGERFNRLAPDAPRGHRILSHQPRYWLKEARS